MIKSMKLRGLFVTGLILVMCLNLTVFAEGNGQPDSWAAEEVTKAIELQLIPSDMYGDYQKAITREEFCLLAIRMVEAKTEMAIDDYLALKGLEMPEYSPFTDNDLYEVIAANVLNIVNGTSATAFEGSKALTREQAAKMLSATAEALGENITALTPSYGDIDAVAEWARPYTGYVYDHNVMKGVGENRFDPKGSYQRQQAFMTMYRLFNAVSQATIDSSDVGTTTDLLSVDEVRALIAQNDFLAGYYLYTEGVMRTPEYDTIMTYDLYAENGDARLEISEMGLISSYAIYNIEADLTYTENMRYTSFGMVESGNQLPLRPLDSDYFDGLVEATNDGFLETGYKDLNGEKVLYVKSIVDGTATSKFWYSLDRLLPLKSEQSWLKDPMHIDGSLSLQTVGIDEASYEGEEVFVIPEDALTRDEEMTGASEASLKDQLTYQVNYISEELTFDGGLVSMFYYSDADFESLVDYYRMLLEGSENYDLYVQENRTSIDGTLGGKMVIVIVNNYADAESERGLNGVNVNVVE